MWSVPMCNVLEPQKGVKVTKRQVLCDLLMEGLAGPGSRRWEAGGAVPGLGRGRVVFPGHRARVWEDGKFWR